MKRQDTYRQRYADSSKVDWKWNLLKKKEKKKKCELNDLLLLPIKMTRYSKLCILCAEITK